MNLPGGVFLVNDKQRDAARTGDFSSWVRHWASLGCWRGYWDERRGAQAADRYNSIVNNRNGQCLFAEYRPGVTFPTVKEEQDRKIMVSSIATTLAAGNAAGQSGRSNLDHKVDFAILTPLPEEY